VVFFPLLDPKQTWSTLQGLVSENYVGPLLA
jgi:hypothetical protein